LPSYCPELNPIEICWKIIRHDVTNSNYFSTIEKLKERLDNFWQRHNFKLILLITYVLNYYSESFLYSHQIEFNVNEIVGKA